MYLLEELLSCMRFAHALLISRCARSLGLASAKRCSLSISCKVASSFGGHVTFSAPMNNLGSLLIL